MASGGKRPGQGRPKGSVSKSTAIAVKLREDMAKMLKERFEPIMKAQLDAAQGIIIEKEGKDGQPVYLSPGPNVQAFRQIQDQVMGRAKESVEVTGKDGGPMLIKLDE